MEVKPISEIKPSLLTKFDCGVEELNTYLKRFAKKNDKLGIGRTYVLLKNARVLGFYTVGMAQIEFNALPKSSQDKLPRYPIPAIRIGRLAVDLSDQGKGLGEILLMNALTRCLRVSEEIAVFAVIVEAKNQQVKDFYLKYGFIPLEEHKLSLFLPISTIIRT